MNSEAANIFAIALEKDAEDHEAGRFRNIGSNWDRVYGEILPIENDVENPLYRMSFRFWDDWCDASNHDWNYHNPINKDQWPNLARELANCLRAKKMPENRILLNNFTVEPRVPLIEKIKNVFTKNT